MKSMIYIIVALLVLVILWLGVKLWSKKGKTVTSDQ